MLRQDGTTDENGEMGYAGRSWRKGGLHKEATLGWGQAEVGLGRLEGLAVGLQVEGELPVAALPLA